MILRLFAVFTWYPRIPKEHDMMIILKFYALFSDCPWFLKKLNDLEVLCLVYLTALGYRRSGMILRFSASFTWLLLDPEEAEWSWGSLPRLPDCSWIPKKLNDLEVLCLVYLAALGSRRSTMILRFSTLFSVNRRSTWLTRRRTVLINCIGCCMHIWKNSPNRCIDQNNQPNKRQNVGSWSTKLSFQMF